MTDILMLDYLDRNPVPSLSRLPEQTYFLFSDVIRCRYRIEPSDRAYKKDVWPRIVSYGFLDVCKFGVGADGITNISSMICTSWSIWHWPNKHRTNLWPHRTKLKEVCSISYTSIERPTSESGKGQKSDIISNVRKMKWSRAGHINRLKGNRWTSSVTTWRLYDKKRWQGRPAKRWRDNLGKYWSDTSWQRTAQDRLTWRKHAEAFAQRRDTTAAQWWWWWWLAPARFLDCDVAALEFIGSLKKWSCPLWRASGIVDDPWHLEACAWHTGEQNMHMPCVQLHWKRESYLCTYRCSSHCPVLSS